VPIVKENRPDSGFSFIEALVALVILGMAAIPILTLLGQSVDQLDRIADTTSKAEVTLSAIAVMDSINPMNQPTGELDMGDYVLSWNAEAVVPPNDNVEIGVGLAGYSVGFYVVEISIWKEQELWFAFDIRKAGYRRIQSTAGPFSTGTR